MAGTIKIVDNPILRNLKSRRRQLLMSAAEVADKLGVSRQSYTHRENGVREFQDGELEQVAAILETTMFDLMLGSELTLRDYEEDIAIWLGTDIGKRYVYEAYKKYLKDQKSTGTRGS